MSHRNEPQKARPTPIKDKYRHYLRLSFLLVNLISCPIIAVICQRWCVCKRIIVTGLKLDLFVPMFWGMQHYCSDAFALHGNARNVKSQESSKRVQNSQDSPSARSRVGKKIFGELTRRVAVFSDRNARSLVFHRVATHDTRCLHSELPTTNKTWFSRVRRESGLEATINDAFHVEKAEE